MAAETWTPLPLDQPLLANVDEDASVSFMTALENCYQTDTGGISRFPGLNQVADLGSADRVYLNDFEGDLIAVTGGQVKRIDRGINVTDVTGLPVAGGRRISFAKSDRELFLAAGGPIVRLRDQTTELLSKNAPLAAKIAWIDNFLIAVEINSGRFFHATAGEPDVWNPLDTFAADGSPDNINAVIVTPFRELLLGGELSTEQFERLTTGNVPFFRRWAIGDGIKGPNTLTFADNYAWAINGFNEFVRFHGQLSVSVGDAIGRLLEQIDDWSDAWLGPPLVFLGQKCLILQIPNATNSYGTKGVTALYDFRQKKFATLYGWENGMPARWPGWSHWRIWDRNFVGGTDGKIYELTARVNNNGGQVQRFLVRTSHMATTSSSVEVKDFRLRLKRGVGGSATESQIVVRASKDGGPFGLPQKRSLGKAGERVQFIEFGGFGQAGTFQFEISCTDDCPVELIKAELKSQPLGH